MDRDAFRHWSTVAAAWGADYREQIRQYPVRAQTAPGEIAAQIPDAPPESPEEMADSVAESWATPMAARCWLWQPSPAATELETRMLDWLRQAVGLPETFTGVIQDSASTATLAAVLTMRERGLA